MNIWKQYHYQLPPHTKINFFSLLLSKMAEFSAIWKLCHITHLDASLFWPGRRCRWRISEARLRNSLKPRRWRRCLGRLSPSSSTTALVSLSAGSSAISSPCLEDSSSSSLSTSWSSISCCQSLMVGGGGGCSSSNLQRNIGLYSTGKHCQKV